MPRTPGPLFGLCLGAIAFLGPLSIHIYFPVIPAVKAAFALSDALVGHAEHAIEDAFRAYDKARRTEVQVTQHNAVHNTLQLLYYGFISTLPGSPATPVYLVTGDFVEAYLEGWNAAS